LTQVGEALCNFLSINATVRRIPGGQGSHAAEVLLLFGSTQHLARDASKPCSPASDEALAAVSPVEWPQLAGVDMLGWRLPAGTATVEVVRRSDTCGGLQVVERLAVPHGALRAKNGGLSLDLSVLNHRLACPEGLRITWQTAVDAMAAA
jgi:hypothetical protein